MTTCFTFLEDFDSDSLMTDLCRPSNKVKEFGKCGGKRNTWLMFSSSPFLKGTTWSVSLIHTPHLQPHWSPYCSLTTPDTTCLRFYRPYSLCNTLPSKIHVAHSLTRFRSFPPISPLQLGFPETLFKIILIPASSTAFPASCLSIPCVTF